MIKGVLDRIEDGLAVILIEELEEQFTIRTEDLPENSEEGTWFTLKKEGENYVIVAIDKELTQQQQQKASSLLEQLRSKKRGSKFKRK